MTSRRVFGPLDGSSSYCWGGATGCADPAVVDRAGFDPDATVYLGVYLHDSGEQVVAVDARGRLKPGWPRDPVPSAPTSPNGRPYTVDERGLSVGGIPTEGGTRQ